MTDTLPRFARLDEYFGAWLMEPASFRAVWEMIRATDLRAHVRAAAEAPAGKPASYVDSVPGPGGKSVAVVRIAGTMMKQRSSMGGTSTVQLRRDIRAAAGDPNVSGILLAIDSPGGTVAGNADLANEVRAARRKKPVVAQIEDLGASAAYWIASQADSVWANAGTALVGSIGTVMTVTDYSGSYEQSGVKVHTFASGPMKAATSGDAPLTGEQAAYLQALVDGLQASFDEAVQKGRGLRAGELAAVRTGEVFTAARAKDLKLIDGIRPLDATLAALVNQK